MSSRLNGWDRDELNRLTERVAKLEERVGRAERVTGLHQKIGGPDAPYKQTEEWKRRHEGG